MLRTSNDDLASIDPELLALAFSFLPHNERAPLSLVCKKWLQANQSHMLHEDEKEIYVGFFINHFAMKTEFRKLTEEKISHTIEQKQFKLYWRAEAETKKEILDYLIPRLAYEDSNTNSGNIYFIGHCKLEGDKLSILSCDRLNYSGQTLQSLAFSPPVICNKAWLKVSSSVYDQTDPDHDGFFQAEYKKQQALLAKKAGKEKSNIKTPTKLDKSDNLQTQTLNDKPLKNPKEPASTTSATLFAKPKPAPSISNPINNRPVKPPKSGSGSCSIS